MNWPEWISPDGRIRLINADCREVLPTLSGVDALVTDPPYGVTAKLNSKTAKRASWNASGEQKKNAYGTFVDSVDHVRNVIAPAFSEALAISKRAILTPGNRCFTLYPMPDSFGCFFQPASVGLQRWGRCDAQPIMYYGKFPRDSKQIPANKCSYTLTERAKVKGHPCPKPLNAWTKLVEVASLEGELVLDIFAGSCTTAIACIATNRRCICIETEPSYWQVGVERCTAEYQKRGVPVEEPWRLTA